MTAIIMSMQTTLVAALTDGISIDLQPELVMALAYLVPANSLLSVSPYRAMVQRGDATQISF